MQYLQSFHQLGWFARLMRHPEYYVLRHLCSYLHVKFCSCQLDEFYWTFRLCHGQVSRHVYRSAPHSHGVSRGSCFSELHALSQSKKVHHCMRSSTNCIRFDTMHIFSAYAVQHLSKILYSFSSLVSSTTLPSVALCLPGFRNMRMAGNMTC